VSVRHGGSWLRISPRPHAARSPLTRGSRTFLVLDEEFSLVLPACSPPLTSFVLARGVAKMRDPILLDCDWSSECPARERGPWVREEADVTTEEAGATQLQDVTQLQQSPHPRSPLARRKGSRAHGGAFSQD
jgi:hypothetical protein